MLRQLDEIQALATKYSKAELGRMVQLGMLEPQKAMMAGMMIQRIEAQNAQPPSTTAVQDVLGLPAVPNQPQQMQPQMGQAPQQPQQAQQPQPQQAPQMGAPVEQPTQMAASGGLTGLPVKMHDYAGGGIVAFDEGGEVPGYAGGPYYGSLVGGSSGEDTDIFGSPRRLPGRGFAAPDPEILRQQLQQVETQINSLPSGRGRAPLEQQRNELRTRLGMENPNAAPPVSDTYPSEGMRGAATFTKPTDTTTSPLAPPPARDAGPRAPAIPREPALGKPSTLQPPTLGQFDPNAIKLTGAKMDLPTVGKLEDITSQREKAEAAAGYNKNLTEEQLKRIEGKQGEFDSRKSQAAGEALMNFGLGLMGARKGQEFQVAGEAGKAALGAYKNDIKDLRSAQEKLDERAEALRVADNQAKKTNSAADIAKLDAQQNKYDAAKLEVFKADNELARTGALVSANVYGTQEHAKTSNYQTQQTALTAREGHQIQLQVAQLHNASQQAYTNAVKQGQLDANIAKIMLDAEKNFMETQAQNFIGKPTELAAAAREHAKRALQTYLPNSRPAANAQMGVLQQGPNGTMTYVRPTQ